MKVHGVVGKIVAVLRHWGVPVKRATPNVWLLNNKEFLRVTVSKGGITVRFLNCFETYDDIAIPLAADWQKELETVLSIPIEHLVTKLLCIRLRRCGFSRFAAGFTLTAGGKKWVIEIFDKERRKVILIEEGDLSKSPLKAFGSITQAVAIASL